MSYGRLKPVPDIQRSTEAKIMREFCALGIDLLQSKWGIFEYRGDFL